MTSTYLQIVNRVLNKLMEVPLNENNFNDARGIQAAIKQAVNDTLFEINTDEYEYPWNAYEHSRTLIPGRNEYSWPEDFKTADWNTFQIQKSEPFNINNRTLVKINREDWYKYYRDLDYDAGDSGRDVPEFVFESHGHGYGVTPSPNQTYLLTFRYYVMPDPLVSSSDVVNLPTEWEHVLYLGTLWHGHMIKNDAQSADRVKVMFDDGVKNMRKLTINRDDTMRDTVINQGGGVFYRSPYVFPR